LTRQVRAADYPDKIRTLFSNLSCVLMEVCGTHTHGIRRAGIHQLLPAGVRLLSGPGCPVCVTGSGYIEQAIQLSRKPKVIIVTFGDLLRVPGNTANLTQARAEGSDIRVVYSPLDALEIAKTNAEAEVIFLGVGFETTAPVIALAVKQAVQRKIRNFSILPAFKLLKPALESLLKSPGVKIDGLIAPGHLSVITGAGAFAFLAERFRLPTVITGFKPEEIWLGIAALLQQISKGRAKLENKYLSVVTAEGNQTAQQLIKEVFEPETAEWRGLGLVPDSGLGLAGPYLKFDSRKRFGLSEIVSLEPAGCRCGEIITGKASPEECPFFGSDCTPGRPVGPCMVSAEGSCAAHFYYRSEVNGS
jgi:hydrogenase expression/formation protein HypD